MINSITPIPASVSDFFWFNMPEGSEVASLLSTTFWMILGIAIIFLIYMVFSAASWVAHKFFIDSRNKAKGYTSLKTVTFGDESAVCGKQICFSRFGCGNILFLGASHRVKSVRPDTTSPHHF